MAKSLIPHSFENHPVRTVVSDGELWFVVKDVMDALEYAESSTPHQAIKHLPDEWKGRNLIPTLGGNQTVAVISEQGLYFFLGRSDKPKALPFQKWLAGEVLPSIRKTGSYSERSDDTTKLIEASFIEAAKVQAEIFRAMSEHRTWQYERWLLVYQDDRQGNPDPFVKMLPPDSIIASAENLPERIPEMSATNDQLERIAAACVAKLKQRAGGDVRSVNIR